LKKEFASIGGITDESEINKLKGVIENNEDVKAIMNKIDDFKRQNNNKTDSQNSLNNED